MGSDNDRRLVTVAAELRRRSEALLNAKAAETGLSGLDDESLRLLHELQVHQIELEMQNEELLRSREELESSRNQYAELYDFAPVGYFTFDARGVIREVNLAGAQLLGMERRLLVDRPFAGFIADADGREVFADHLSVVLQRQVMQQCEVRLTGTDGGVIHGHLQSLAVPGEQTAGRILTSIVDATVRKQLREALQQAHDKLEETVQVRTSELTRANLQLTEKIAEHMRAEESLRDAYAEIRRMKNRLKAENIYLHKEVDREYNFGEIIGHSTPLEYVFLQVEQVAPMNATVLLLGETGTGKGVVARAIHSRSPRKERPMITVNCATLPASIIESELFGREKGAFTGADSRQIGRFELADGGTIFLDEIGEIPLALQSKLLRAIQDGEFERLGSPRTIKVNVRIIAATNRNLEEAIKDDRFREDLYYRLNVFPITLPPLRQRTDDIPLLVNHFVAKFNKKIGKQIETVPSDTLNTLQEYHWPGNVRELENVIERAVIMSQGTVLQVLDQFATAGPAKEPAVQDVKALAELERHHILLVLQKTGWRINGEKGAAMLLGLNPSTLRARMRKYGILRE